MFACRLKRFGINVFPVSYKLASDSKNCLPSTVSEVSLSQVFSNNTYIFIRVKLCIKLNIRDILKAHCASQLTWSTLH